MRYVLISTAILGAVVAYGQAPTAPEQEVINLVNQQRAANKLPPLAVNAQLMLAARNHSANMARQNTGSHVLDGIGPGERLKQVGYRGRAWGENIAWGTRNAQQVMNLWMQSPPHRSNILNSHYTEIGVAIAYSTRGVPYWTQVFGRR